MTRRHVFTVAARRSAASPGRDRAARVGFALAPLFDSRRRPGSGRPRRGLHRRDLQPVVFTARRRRSARPARPPPTCASGSEDLGEDPEEYVAISTRCAHLGCPVRFVEAAGNFICPCHGGVYDFEGKVIGGPPVRPLDRFQTRVPRRPGRDRPPLQRHLPARAGPRPRPRRVHRRDLGIPLPAAALDPAAALSR